MKKLFMLITLSATNVFLSIERSQLQDEDQEQVQNEEVENKDLSVEEETSSINTKTDITLKVLIAAVALQSIALITFFAKLSKQNKTIQNAEALINFDIRKKIENEVDVTLDETIAFGDTYNWTPLAEALFSQNKFIKLVENNNNLLEKVFPKTIEACKKTNGQVLKTQDHYTKSNHHSSLEDLAKKELKLYLEKTFKKDLIKAEYELILAKTQNSADIKTKSEKLYALKKTVKSEIEKIGNRKDESFTQPEELEEELTAEDELKNLFDLFTEQYETKPEETDL